MIPATKIHKMLDQGTPQGNNAASPAVGAILPQADDARDREGPQYPGNGLILSTSVPETNIQASSPVSLVPSELLERIFLFCMRLIYTRRLPANCLAWTQVCTHWRRVALDSARLWQYVDISHSRFAREFLTRSKSAPIFIVAHSPEKRFTGSFHSHAERICSINVVLRSADMQDLLASLGSELPNLSTLALALQAGSQNLRYNIRLPSVRHLTLDGVAVPWNHCSNLKHLSLRGLGEGFAPSASQLYSILDRSPELESLRTENLAINIPFWEKASDPIVVLSQLRELVLFSQTPQFVHYMLTQLHIPPPAKLRLTCPSYSQLSQLGPLFTENEKILDADIGAVALRLRRWSVQLLRNASSPWSENYSDISLSITFLSPWQAPQIHDFRHLFDISRLMALELDAVVLDDIPKDSMLNLFAAMPCLQTLRVALNELEALLTILGPDTPALTGGVLCPNLSVLSFSRSGEVWWGFAERWLQGLLACIRNRGQHSHLRTLGFTRCHGIDSQVVRPFEPFVDKILIKE